jgi:hypothetical protein
MSLQRKSTPTSRRRLNVLLLVAALVATIGIGNSIPAHASIDSNRQQASTPTARLAFPVVVEAEQTPSPDASGPGAGQSSGTSPGALVVSVNIAKFFGGTAGKFDKAELKKQVNNVHNGSGTLKSRLVQNVAHANAVVKSYGADAHAVNFAQVPDFTGDISLIDGGDGVRVTVPHDRIQHLLLTHGGGPGTAGHAPDWLAGIISLIVSNFLTFAVTSFCTGLFPAAVAACYLSGGIVGSVVGGAVGQALTGSLNDKQAWKQNIIGAIAGTLTGFPKVQDWMTKTIGPWLIKSGQWVRANVATLSWISFLGYDGALRRAATWVGDVGRLFPRNA